MRVTMKGNDASFYIIGAMAFLILIMVYRSMDDGGSFVSKYSIDRVVINDKFIKRVGQSDKYLVSTDQGVFEVSDSVIHGQFRSADVYGMIYPGNCYSFQVYGFRSGLTSSYPTILEVKQMGC
jgi:hypothetical protein